jgi:hypothetical protein
LTYLQRLRAKLVIGLGEGGEGGEVVNPDAARSNHFIGHRFIIAAPVTSSEHKIQISRRSPSPDDSVGRSCHWENTKEGERGK